MAAPKIAPRNEPMWEWVGVGNSDHEIPGSAVPGLWHDLQRLPVPGGWLYRDTTVNGVALAFVPDPSSPQR